MFEIDNKKIRNQFPMLKNDIVYLDSAALVQKPQQVIDAINDFYTKYSISNRTRDTRLGIFVEQKIQETRKLVAQLLKCSDDEIIFNSGTTEGLNYASYLIEQLIEKDDQILISKFNHSSHMVPWIELAKRKQAKIVFSDNLLKDVNSKTKIIAYTQVNNNFLNNKDDELEKLFSIAKKNNAFIINDIAQAISHKEVDSKFFDIAAFSSNKMFGPTGLGILYVSKHILNKVESKKYGGGSIDYIEKDGIWKSKNSIIKHEPGTLNIAGIFGFNEALKFYNSIDKKWMEKYLNFISSYAYDKLKTLDNVNILSNKGDLIMLLEIKNSTSQDVASYLGHKDIYVRSGFFCAHYLKHLVQDSLLRISFHIYNNLEDIDKLYQSLKEGGDFLGFL